MTVLECIVVWRCDIISRRRRVHTSCICFVRRWRNFVLDVKPSYRYTVCNWPFICVCVCVFVLYTNNNNKKIKNTFMTRKGFSDFPSSSSVNRVHSFYGFYIIPYSLPYSFRFRSKLFQSH